MKMQKNVLKKHWVENKMREIIWAKHGENAFNDIYEIDIKPWKIYYKILNDNKLVSIQYILDTRRNIEEVLLNLVIENKL